MPSIKRLLAVVGAIVALVAIVPSAAASSHTAFHLQKTCVDNFTCTVLWSTYEAMPQGTEITYTYNGDGSDGLAYPTIHAVGGTATGVCDWNHPAGPIQAKCTFDTGTGALTGFHLTVRVSANANGSVWYWDGTYWFDN